MRTMLIKELAELLGISTRTIRFYEEKGMISPEKHPTNHYRVFTEQDARRLQTIISLREVGMPIEEVRALLVELDKGDQDHVLYALELQRSMMFSQFVELKHNIATTDRIINHIKHNQAIEWKDIFEITNGLKKLRDLRTNWRDHWDFDRQAEFHDELVYDKSQEFNQHPSYEIALQMILDWVNPHRGEKGLDIGTGTGNLAGLFMERGIEICGIDQSKEMLRQCQRKFPDYETKLGNFLAIPYLDHGFDFAVTSYAFHHLTEEQQLLALDEITRVLKPHGRVCIVDLMFENEAERRTYLDRLRSDQKHAVIAAIENEFYADRSKLINWFEAHDYVVKFKQISELVHIIYAVPTRISY